MSTKTCLKPRFALKQKSQLLTFERLINTSEPLNCFNCFTIAIFFLILNLLKNSVNLQEMYIQNRIHLFSANPDKTHPNHWTNLIRKISQFEEPQPLAGTSKP